MTTPGAKDSIPPRMHPYGSPVVEPIGLGGHTRAIARKTLRRIGTATAGARMGPNYLIIGTKRGGTTSMAKWLLAHPQVRTLWPPRETRKGTYFFDVNYSRGTSWYHGHFPTKISHRLAERKAGKELIVGEATPYYLYHPHAAQRAFSEAPNAKVIALLRNPIDRAFGHWMERTRNGVETLAFGDAIRVEAERLEGEEQRMIDDPTYVSFAHQHYSYVDQGRYSRGLNRWRDAYGEDQMLIIRSEDMYADPPGIYRQVTQFLGLEAFQPEAFAAWNLKPKEPLDPADSDWLRVQLEADIRDVELLLNRGMDWL